VSGVLLGYFEWGIAPHNFKNKKRKKKGKPKKKRKIDKTHFSS